MQLFPLHDAAIRHEVAERPAFYTLRCSVMSERMDYQSFSARGAIPLAHVGGAMPDDLAGPLLASGARIVLLFSTGPFTRPWPDRSAPQTLESAA